MITLEEEINGVKNDTTKIGDTAPKLRSLSDVVKQGNYTFDDVPEFQSRKWVKFKTGFENGIHEMSKTAQGLEIWAGQAALSIGGISGSSNIENYGRSLIKSAYSEAEAKDKEYMQKAVQLSPSEYDDFSTSLGMGVANYGGMLALGYITGGLGTTAKAAGVAAEVGGIGSMFALELSGKAQDKIKTYIEKGGDVDFKEYTADVASKDFMFSAMYAAGSAILEKKFGYGEQRKLFKMPYGERLKNIAKTAASEGGTELSQSLYETGIDLTGGYIDTSKLPERFMQAVQEGVVGAVLGGTAGIAAAINHRSQAKAILREELQNTVPAKDLDNVVDAVYESTSDSMQNIVAQELIQSEELRNKHGAVYDSIKGEIYKQINDIGAYSDVDEMKLSQYVEGTAKQFADQVLGEANKRGVVIDDVLKASEIVYKDGRLYLQEMPEEKQKAVKLKRLRDKRAKAEKYPSMLQFIRLRGGIIDTGGELKAMDAGKQFIGLVNKNGVRLDDMGGILYESGYFQERPTEREVLEYIEEELKGVKHYPLGYAEQKGFTQAENEMLLNSEISEYADIMGYDLSKMSYEEKEQIYEQMQRNLNSMPDDGVDVMPTAQMTTPEDIDALFDLSEPFFQIAEENARLDEQYPAYEGETITINGQEKTVYNSNGDRIAKSKEALENFYRWFGDSKVVDEQGRPLVVYHGTGYEFDTFDTAKRGGNTGNRGFYGDGFYLTDRESEAKFYAQQSVIDRFTSQIFGNMGYEKAQQFLNDKSIIMNVYVSLKNPLIWNDIKTEKEAKALSKKIGMRLEWNEKYKQINHFRDDKKSIKFSEKLKEAGYDGIIYKGDNGSEIVAFNPNQIKSTSNRGTYSESKNIYYQEDSQENLIMTHSAKLDNLDDIIKSESLVAPSLAITNKNQETLNNFGFGDVVFVRNPESIDYKNDNIYDRDIYSPRMPSPTYKTREGYISSYEYDSMKREWEYDKEKFKKNHDGMTFDEYFAGAEKYIFKGFTPSGTRKYVPYTAENALAEMKKQGLKGGENFNYGLSSFLAKLAKKQTSKKQLKKTANELGIVDIKTYDDLREQYSDFEDKLREYAKDDYKGYEMFDDIYPDVMVALATGKTKDLNEYMDMPKLRKENPELLQQVDDFIIKAVTTNRSYFEAKPMRILPMNEFSAVLVPENVTKEQRQGLERLGLEVIDYKRGHASEALQNVKGKIFFQVKNLPKQKGKIKGAFDALTKSIEITSEADFSTYQHEFAHFWLDNIWNYAQSGKASERYMRQFNELKKWLGVEGKYPNRQQHEKFARAYEKYLYNGNYATPIIGDVFREYEDFIREVYSSIAEIDTRAGLKKYKPVPRKVYDFFNSMVSGELPYYGDIEEPKKVVEQETKEVKSFVKEEQKQLTENTQNYALKPVQTDTKTGYLTAYKKMTGQDVEAGAISLQEEMQKAEKFVNENPERAKRIVDGVEQVPDGMIKNTIYMAYDKLQKRLGNTQNRVNSLLNQAMELRRYGQEIATQRLAYESAASPLYWIQAVQESKASALADFNKMSVKELNDLVKKSIADGIKQNKTAKEIAKDLREQLGVTEFYQEEVYPTEETDNTAYNYIYKYVNEQLGLSMSMQEAETITRKADDMLSSLENSKATNGNPSVDYFVKEKDLENYANSIAPSSQARIIVSVIGRGNLLFSIKSPMTNIVSNAFVGAYRAAVRRIMLKTPESIVSPELIRQNKQYSWEIFRKTGYNVNNITPETPRNTILGERLTHSEGKGAIRWLGRFYENLIYKWSLGAGDVIFKDYAFNDYVALRATKEAMGDVKKANAIYKDACLIEPMTELGKQIRADAIQESLIATYQNKGLLSEKALKAREAIDFGVGFGEFIAPFVKTPANVVSMGLKAGFGSVKAITSEIIRDVKAGKIQPMTKENIDLVVQNGIGLLVSFLLLSAIDDEDYMPPYAIATNKDKQLAKELNIAYNSIRIGDNWFSLDYLGPLAAPLVGLLQARREDGILNKIFGYAKSGAMQSLSIPAFGNIADIFKDTENMIRKDGTDVAADALNGTIQAVYSRTVPSIMSDVAKMLDMYDRETKGHEIQAKIPFAREWLPEKVSVTSGRAETTDNPIQELLFGARGKTQIVNPVADELLRLNNSGYGVSLTPITQRGLLSDLDDSTKDSIRRDFAKEYSKAVGNLIKTPKYKKMDDEDKQNAIDKIRDKIRNDLKRRYLHKR